ncbi:hypothetical protein OBBRIDRAFT_358654 [Obba rivulosa]|uniref:Uncharacterized protein n=1 Tax=Obba rivulosa TaxID=1052685 RepID=A0A8E2DUT4_9APHY|nr:hypothetical protein OBBRIDRAFT_358654 [Obba rivulosa]
MAPDAIWCRGDIQRRAIRISPATELGSLNAAYDSIKISDLDLVDIPWRFLSLQLRAFICTHFKLVVSLKVKNILFNNSNQMLRVLEAFPLLRNLEITNAVWLFDNHTTQQISRNTSLKFDNLYTDGSFWRRSHPLPDWFFGRRNSIAIGEASLTSHCDNIDRLVTFLHLNAPKLKILCYDQVVKFEDGDLPPPEAMFAYVLQPAPVLQADDIERILQDPHDALIFPDDEVEPDRAALAARVDFDARHHRLNSYALAIQEAAIPVTNSALKTIDALVVWKHGVLDLFMLQYLCKLITPRTTDVRFTIGLRTLDRLDSVNWPALDALFANIPESPTLRSRYSLEIAGNFDDLEAAKRILMQRLLNTVDRDLFDFDAGNGRERWYR